MTENQNNEELTEEEFLQLVLDEQEKALAKAREERLNPQKNKARRRLLIRLSVNYIRKNGMILFVTGLK